MSEHHQATAIRDSRVVCYFTPDDAAFLFEVAKASGMSRSSLISSIMERAIIGGFSPLVFLKIGLQLQKRIESRSTMPSQGLYFGLRPLPPLPDDDLAAEDIQEVINQLEHETQPC